MAEIAHLLILTGPGLEPAVFEGSRADIHRALGGLRTRWGANRTAVDRARRALVCVDGRAAFLVDGRFYQPTPTLAVLAPATGDPRAVFLVADQLAGQVLSAGLDVETLIVPLRSLTELRESMGSGSLLLEFARAGGLPDMGQPRGETWCPRCREQLLYRDPIFDSRSRRDGTRICNACGLLEAVAAEQARRDRAGL